ncbi:MAG: hypothetical protein V1644_03485 [Candidatus Micrarchaeota archaeon]
MAFKKKVIDTWKAKLWYGLIAPKLFNEVEVAQVPSQDPQHLLNRIIELPLKDITKDLSHLYINVKLRVEEIRGKSAYTKFIGHAIAREHLQALGRRNRSMLYSVFPAKSVDGVEFSVKVLIVTNGKASTSQRIALRRTLKEVLTQKVSKQEFSKFILDVLYGKASSELHGTLKKIFPTKRVEIYKTELKEVFDVENVESQEGETAEASEGKQGAENEAASEEETETPVENVA